MAFGWLSERSGIETSCPKNFLEINRYSAMTVILQHDWLIEQCLLHIRVFFGGKTRSPCFDLFIHWLIKQITITYRSFQGHTKIAYIAEKKASCTNFDGTYDHSHRRETSFAVSYWVKLFSIPVAKDTA